MASYSISRHAYKKTLLIQELQGSKSSKVTWFKSNLFVLFCTRETKKVSKYTNNYM